MKGSPSSRPTSISFLLTQIGADAAARYATRLASLQLQPSHAGVLRRLAQTAGVNQQELAERLGMHASRLVGRCGHFREARIGRAKEQRN